MSVLVLGRQQVRELMQPADYLEAVTWGFRALGEGRTRMPAPLHLPCEHGGFHAKAALLQGERRYVALKFNANMPGNPAARGLPTIQGSLILCDGDDGRWLAVMDSVELTLRRTAATTALAARHLARPESALLALCGCGAQAWPQVEALREVLPLRRVRLWDRDVQRAEALRHRLAASTGLGIEVAESCLHACRGADVIVTCTTATQAFLGLEAVSPGAFVAAVGADSPSKSEITPQLMAASRVVVDSLAQCAEMGDLRHAIAAGAMSRDQVHAELGAIVCGRPPGRSEVDQICLFDSTGVAVQDVACAARLFERAGQHGLGVVLDMAGES